MDAKFLEKEEKLIRQSILRKYDKSNDHAAPLYDGIVNIEKYISAKPRICWILKEPYDSEYPANEGGGWSITKDYLGQKQELLAPALHNSDTWRRITYITYSLLNNFLPYGKLAYITDKPEMADSLQNIAVLNIGKMPATSTAKDADIAYKYDFWKPILLRQINSYDPHILIFGNTFKYFLLDLGLSENEVQYVDNVEYVVSKNKLYLSAYHPAVRPVTISEEVYCNEIIDTVKKNIKKLVLD
jgi:hypothetical protein